MQSQSLHIVSSLVIFAESREAFRGRSSVLRQMEQVPKTQEKYAAVWRQFLVAKRGMLAEYERALSHAKTQPVATHHGNVAEAAFRDWLAAFLPKRFGVT